MISLEPPSTRLTSPTSPSTTFLSTEVPIKFPLEPNPTSFKLPTEIISHIFDCLSSSSIEDLKTCTQISIQFYPKYSKLLYKRLHIKSYNPPIKMKLMMSKYRKGYYPFTEEDEESYKKFVIRRLDILKSCEYLTFNCKKDVKSTIKVLSEFKLNEKNPFENVKYLILDGRHGEFDLSLEVNGKYNKILANKIWEIIKPIHICIKIYSSVMKSSRGVRPSLYPLRIQDDFNFILKNSNNNNLKSVNYHNYSKQFVTFNEKYTQNYFIHYKDNEKSTLNDRIIITECLLPKKSKDNQNFPYCKIEISNWSSPNHECFAWNRSTDLLENVDLDEEHLAFHTPEDTKSCICCGKK